MPNTFVRVIHAVGLGTFNGRTSHLHGEASQTQSHWAVEVDDIFDGRAGVHAEMVSVAAGDTHHHRSHHGPKLHARLAERLVLFIGWPTYLLGGW